MSNNSVKEKILISLDPVIKNSSSIRIDNSKIPFLAKKLEKYPIPVWDNVLEFLGNPEEIIQYYFFLDSINFCFWNIQGKERWEIEKDGKWIHGYHAFAHAIKNAFLVDKRLFNASYLSSITFNEFSKIFNGKGELLLLRERHEIIQGNFKILRKKHGGKALNLVVAGENNVNSLVELIIKDFPTFRDCIDFRGQKVYFLKRAQLFVSDINHAFQGENYGYFKNMKDLTIFVDYKLPQLLELEGVLVYNEKIRNKIKNRELIKKGSEEESEIRANTIYACEILLRELNILGRKLTSNNLDWMLWVLSQENQSPLPYHRTITTNY
ncbi:MAG: queuosine salvage family protein [Candidatus Nealsonbacteria bacterium]